ncbi:MAG: hypothetical protein ACR2NU_03240 [Aeoliella sp.]
MSLRRFFRFRIISLLILTALICGGLAWFVQPKQVVVEAIFRVRSQPGSRLHALDGGERRLSEEEVDVFRATLQELATSQNVIQAALTDPALVGNALLRATDDPLDWIKNHLETGVEGASELMTLSIEGREERSADLHAIVDAVADAFNEEVVTRRKYDRMKTRDSLSLILSKRNKELREKINERNFIASELSPEERDSSAELIIRNAEIEVLSKVAAEVAEQIERWDIELRVRPRVELMQQAAVRVE